MVGDPAAFFDLFGTFGDAPPDMPLGIPSADQPPFLGVKGRRNEQDDHRLGLIGQHLAGSLDLDFKQHIAPLGRDWPWCPIEVPQELGPLEKAVVSDFLAKRRLIGEDVRALIFSISTRTSRP
jgi:hypothetical protein